MTYYANIENGIINGGTQCIINTTQFEQVEITEELFNNIEKCILVDGNVVIDSEYETKQAKKQRKEEILDLLNEIDLKSIRALRAGETERLEELEHQAIELRKELGEL